MIPFLLLPLLIPARAQALSYSRAGAFHKSMELVQKNDRVLSGPRERTVPAMAATAT
jgi:hypothetical protein